MRLHRRRKDGQVLVGSVRGAGEAAGLVTVDKTAAGVGGSLYTS